MKRSYLNLIMIFFAITLASCGPGKLFGPTLTPTPTRTPTPTFTPFSSIPTQSSAPYSYRDCENSKPYTGVWSAKYNGMLFEAFLCPDGTLIAIFHNQDIPEFIMINRKPSDEMEFSWGVHIDVDSDNTTGTTERYLEGIVGADYQILLAHWSSGEEEIIPFSDAFQIDVWHCANKRCASISDAEQFIDRQNKLLILRGLIPGMSSKSKILFSQFFLSVDNRLTYKTNWVSSNNEKE
jgi:hypothetical protein